MTERPRPLPYFGAPPARQPRPSRGEPTLWGKRVILSTPEGFIYDMRAISEIHVNGAKDSVDIASEEDYYRWMFTSEPPRVEPYPAHLVWVE
ncbi:hypothetical protein D0Z08_17545 [Nocardioides immobilis]|uniref:Uncharacterized protein n=1 Tax=Nocardioides immobilis TaxID=2049295 RepID=A0A417XZM1_9ACTN|nr:hypothetical protein [Nocardioides immobilis]RHW25840.1 hypothetical protein D0Z08_17545 [Nocardioides immobilis]